MPKLTKRAVDAAKRSERDYFIWDAEMPGFGLRVFPSGRKSYIIQYRIGARTRRFTIGRHGTLTPDEARTRARKFLVEIGDGADPAKQKKIDRLAPTMADLGERFMHEHTAERCKPSTQLEYRRCLNLFIKPALGTHRVRDVTRADVARLHQAHSHIPYQANRTLGVLSIMFNLAELWGLRPEGLNPCRRITKYPERKRERFLSFDELTRLGRVLDEVENDGSETKSAVAAFRLLILTGCRLKEIQTLKWSYVRGNRIHLPDSKTGYRKVYLGPPVLEVLSKIELLADNEYVITGAVPGKHLTDLQKPWRRIRKRAGFEDVRIHDLRHSFASCAVQQRESLPMIGKLLGHTQYQTTARYAHLADEPMIESAARVSGSIASHLYAGIET